MFRTERIVFLRYGKNDSYYLCDVLRCHHLKKLFRDPCESSLLNFVYTNEENMNHVKTKVIHTSELYRKVVCLTYVYGYKLVPMLHGQEGQ